LIASLAPLTRWAKQSLAGEEKMEEKGDAEVAGDIA
jgi:hypothetical protein